MPFIDLNFGGQSVTQGDATVAMPILCPATVVAGDVVYVSGNKVGALWQVDKVDIFSTLKMPAIGVITQKLTSTTGIVIMNGEVSGLYTGLTPNVSLFANSLSRLDETPPARPASGLAYVHAIARVLSSDTIFINLKTPLIKVSS